jgi:hypothetical protein
MHRTIYPARGEPFIEASVCTAGRMSLLDRGMYVRSYCVCVYGRADVAARRTVRQGKARKARWRRCRRFMSTMVDADALTGRCQTMAAVDVWQPVDARVPYALKRRVSSVPRVAHGRVPGRPDAQATCIYVYDAQAGQCARVVYHAAGQACRHTLGWSRWSRVP